MTRSQRSSDPPWVRCPRHTMVRVPPSGYVDVLCLLNAGHDHDCVYVDPGGYSVTWSGDDPYRVWAPGEGDGRGLTEIAQEVELHELRKARPTDGRLPPALAGAVDVDRERQVRDIGAKRLGFSGELCGHCGSMQTRRTGKCVHCLACGQDGGCG